MACISMHEASLLPSSDSHSNSAVTPPPGKVRNVDRHEHCDVNTRRREQNRINQRTFRERRQRRIENLEFQLNDLLTKHRMLLKSYSTQTREFCQLRQTLDNLGGQREGVWQQHDVDNAKCSPSSTSRTLSDMSSGPYNNTIYEPVSKGAEDLHVNKSPILPSSEPFRQELQYLLHEVAEDIGAFVTEDSTPETNPASETGRIDQEATAAYETNFPHHYVHHQTVIPKMRGNPKRVSNRSDSMTSSPRLPAPMHAATMNNLQVLHYFLNGYLPDLSASCREHQTPSSWMAELPEIMGQSHAVDVSLSALCFSYIGARHQNEVFARRGADYYHSALGRIKSQLLKASVEESLLHACMIVVNYEIQHATCGGNQGWMFHVRGTCSLLQRRGPPSKKRPLDMKLYSRIRTAALWNSWWSGTPSFLTLPEWQGLSHLPYDRLLDILLRIQCMQADLDHMNKALPTPVHMDAVNGLLRRCEDLEDELLDWYTRFQHGEDGQLFMMTPIESNHLPYLIPDSDVNQPFSEMITFSSPNLAQILIVYWAGQLMHHQIMANVLAYRQSQSQMVQRSDRMCERDDNGDHERMQNLEAAGESFANRICQAIAGCSQRGFQGVVFQSSIAPLCAAQLFFSTRSPQKSYWCRTTLLSMNRQGPFGIVVPLKTNEVSIIRQEDHDLLACNSVDSLLHR